MAKGGDFERDTAKFLTLWLTGKKKPYKYWRMDASGSLATIHEENEDLAGDIKSLARDADFLTDIFVIECKTGYPKTSFWQHWSSANFQIKEFWNKLVKVETPKEKYPMLIYRKKGRRRLVGISEFPMVHFSKKLSDLNFVTIHWNGELPDLYFYDFNEFWDRIVPEDIKSINNQRRLDYDRFSL